MNNFPEKINIDYIKLSYLNKEKVFLIVRYLFSGGLAFMSNIGLLFIFEKYFDWWYLISSTLAFVTSVIISFLAQKYVTFRDTTTDRIHQQMIQYVFIALFNVMANAIIVFIFVDFIHFLLIWAQIVSGGIIAMWSLFVYYFIIFSKRKINYEQS